MILQINNYSDNIKESINMIVLILDYIIVIEKQKGREGDIRKTKTESK